MDKPDPIARPISEETLRATTEVLTEQNRTFERSLDYFEPPPPRPIINDTMLRTMLVVLGLAPRPEEKPPEADKTNEQ